MNASTEAAIVRERKRQDAKWGQQNHLNGTGRPGDRQRAVEARARCQANGPAEDNWRDILDEEIAEAYAETELVDLRAELIQVAAVVGAWIEAIDRRIAAEAEVEALFGAEDRVLEFLEEAERPPLAPEDVAYEFTAGGDDA